LKSQFSELGILLKHMTHAQLQREFIKIARYAITILIVATLTHFGIDIGNDINPVELTPPSLEYQDEKTAQKTNFVTGTFPVTRIVDGDTIIVSMDGTDTTVRYIGIDTPETKDPRREVECFGAEASQKNAELVEGKTVTLSLDSSDTDKYGRLLRYVSVASGTESIDVGLELISGGFATALAIEPDTDRYRTYKEAERTARSQNVGLWGSTCSQ
jgi:micrococcal nuclease